MTNPAPQLFTNGVLSHTIYQTCQKNLLFVQTIKFHYLTSFLVLPLFEQGDYLRKNLSIFLYTWTNKTPQSLSKTNLCVVSFHRGKFRYSTPSRALEVRQWKLVTASYIQNGLKKKTMTSCTTRKPEYLSIFWRRRILEYSKHATHRWHGIRARSCEEYRKYIEYGIQKKTKERVQTGYSTVYSASNVTEYLRILSNWEYYSNSNAGRVFAFSAQWHDFEITSILDFSKFLKS